MAFWLLLSFWCLLVTGRHRGVELAVRDNSARAIQEYFVDAAEPSYCLTFTYEYLVLRGAPTDYWPLPPYGNPTGLPGPGGPGNTLGPGPGPGTGLPPGGTGTLPGGGGITTRPQGSATRPGQTIGSGGQGTVTGTAGQGTGASGQGTGTAGQGTGPAGQGTGTAGQGTGTAGQGTGTAGQGTLTTLPTTTSPGSIIAPTPGPPLDLSSPAGRSFVINLRLYLRAPNDTFVTATTDPPVGWATLSGSDLSINAPDVTSQYTLVIRMRAANAQGAPYEVIINLKIEPVVLVPITADNAFSIDLTKYLDSSGDAGFIETDPIAPWVTYTRPIQRIAGRVPAGYKEPRTIITVNVLSQKGGTYVRYFGLVFSPVPVVPLALGGQLSMQLVPYLLATEDVISSVKTNPNSTWVNFNPGPKTLSGVVPSTLDNSSIIVTALATSFTKGLDYSFQLELYIQDSSKPDLGILVPVVASNNFTIITSKYFPASVRLSAVTTVPSVSWVNFDPAKGTVGGKVPDLVAGTVVKLMVNASSAATPGSESATYSKLFNLEVQRNEVLKFNVTLGAQFGIDLGSSLLSPPGDYLTSISTLPISNWVTLGTNGKTIGGVVPLNLAAGTSVAVAGTAFNPTLDSSYNKDFSLEITAGSDIKVPVLIGGDFQINLTDFLRNADDTVKFTTSPPVDWVKLSPTPPPALIGTVPVGYDGNELNITILATSKSNGFTYTILAALQMFSNEAKVEIFQAEILRIDLRPLLKTPDDLIESIQKFPAAEWLILDTEGKFVSGIVPLNQPGGSSVNITVNGLSLEEPDARIGRLRGPARLVAPRQLRRYFPYSVLVSVKIFERAAVSSSTSISTTDTSMQSPRSTPPQSTGPSGVSSGANQPTLSGGASAGSSAPSASQPSGASFSSNEDGSSPSTPVLPPSSGGEAPTTNFNLYRVEHVATGVRWSLVGRWPTAANKQFAWCCQPGPKLSAPELRRHSANADARILDLRAQPIFRGATLQLLLPTRAVDKLAYRRVSAGLIARGHPAVIRSTEPDVGRTEPIASTVYPGGVFGLNPFGGFIICPKHPTHSPADHGSSHIVSWCSDQSWRPVCVKRSWNILPRCHHFVRGLSTTQHAGDICGIKSVQPVHQSVPGHSLSTNPNHGNPLRVELIQPVHQPIPGDTLATKPNPGNPRRTELVQPVSQPVSGNSLGTKPIQPQRPTDGRGYLPVLKRWPGAANFCVDEWSVDRITRADHIDECCSADPVTHAYRIHECSTNHPFTRAHRPDE